MVMVKRIFVAENAEAAAPLFLSMLTQTSHASDVHNFARHASFTGVLLNTSAGASIAAIGV